MQTRALASDVWTPELAERTARELGVVLRPSHWHVLAWARELSAARGRSPDLNALSRTTGLSVDALRALFPDADHSIGRIAGVS